MVTAVQHLNRSLGIDLTQSSEVQSRSNLLPGYKHNGDSDLTRCPSHLYLEAIYDAVVGINEEKGSNFDREGLKPGKIGTPELEKLIEISVQMGLRDGTTDGQKAVLKNIVFASAKYILFLKGDVSVLKKDMVKLGNRHTLMRGNRNHIYEMTNSMTQNELALFKKKTKLLIDPTENLTTGYVQGNKKYACIEMGSGAFGKTRIARDINSDTFVAVKKAHPKLKASNGRGFYMDAPEGSNFYRIKGDKQRAIGEIPEFVISPFDECHVVSKQSELAEKMNNFVPVSTNQLQEKINTTKGLAQALDDLGDNLDDFLTKMADSEFVGNKNSEKTLYGFSELGMTTVDGMINKFNVLRSYFESRKDSELSAEAENLLMRYSREYDELSVIRVFGNETDRIFQALGMQRFTSSDFKLKDPVYNQKFLNTLGKKMITALAKLNAYDITHQDIKPDNIVICQDDQGLISVKLIDIDLIQKISGERKQPEAGCLAYMPPEALINERDGSISYTGDKGDAYAMGLTLRKILGFGCAEIAGLNKLQKLKISLQRLHGSADRSTESALKTGLAQAVHELDVIGDFEVQNQLHIKAISEVVPEALSLKDMADLMLKEHPGKRLSAKDVLADYSFFSDENNLLDDAEFSDHAHRICRFGIVTDKEETKLINNRDPASPDGLTSLRQSAMQKMILSRGQNLIGYEGGSLSKKELDKVKSVERGIQAQAGVRRLGRSFINLLSPAMSDADKINAYKKR